MRMMVANETNALKTHQPVSPYNHSLYAPPSDNLVQERDSDGDLHWHDEQNDEVARQSHVRKVGRHKVVDLAYEVLRRGLRLLGGLLVLR